MLRIARLRRCKKWVILGRIANIWWMGPYDTKADAQEDLSGVLRTIKANKGIFKQYGVDDED